MERETKIGLASFVLGVGLEVSGLTLPFVGYFLMFLGVVLFLHATLNSRFHKVVPTESAITPNWSVRDLFFYIEPGVLDDDKADRAIEIGNEIRDKAALGQLKFWGRPLPSEGSIENLFRESHVPLEPIDESYWRKADFTYRFFTDDRQFIQHTYPDDGSRLLPFADLQVNKAEALRIWSERKKPLDANDRSIWLAFAVPIILLLILASPMAISDTSKFINYAYPYLKRWVFPPIEPSMGIEDALIRPYQSDPNLMEIGLEIKNVSDKLIHYRVQDFVISIDGDKKLYLTRKATDTKSLPQTMGTVLWFSSFSDLMNAEQQFATFDFVIEYGPKRNVVERLLKATFSCDMVRGKQDSIDCVIKKESDEEIP